MLAHKGPQRITKPSRAVSVHDPQPPFIRNNRIVQSLLHAGHRIVDGGTNEHEVTRVSFRPLTARDLAAYVASREWQGRAGGYAIQGLGAALVERIEGDYLNVVGLPAALLVRLLSERFAGVYGFG